MSAVDVQNSNLPNGKPNGHTTRLKKEQQDDGIEEIIRESVPDILWELDNHLSSNNNNNFTNNMSPQELSAADSPFSSVLFGDSPAPGGGNNNMLDDGTFNVNPEDVMTQSALTTYQSGALDPLYASNITELSPDNRFESLDTKTNLIPTADRAYFKKPKPKRLTNGNNKRPAFVTKLWNMVNDKSNQDYIRWMPDGKSFQVLSRETFMKDVLPKYFKHKNFASFVRQLNMYGWHKVQDVNSGSLNTEELWQFENPNFMKDREDLLENIVRNRSKADDDEELDLQLLLGELETIKKNQRLIAEDLRRVRHDNETLWKENFIARERHKNQSQTLDKILRFLASVYGTSKNLDIQNIASMEEPSIDHSKEASPQAYNRPMLMITQNAHKRSASNGSAVSGTPQKAATQPVEPPVEPQVEESPIQEIYRGNDIAEDLPYMPDNFDQASRTNATGKALFPEFADSIQSPIKTQSDMELYGNSAAAKYHHDGLRGLENTIARQGDSIKHVQDWISKLHQNFKSADNNYDDASSRVSDAKFDDQNFDVDDYLNAETPIEDLGSVRAPAADDARIDDIFDETTTSTGSTPSTEWMSGSKRAKSAPNSETPPKKQTRRQRDA